MSKDSKPNMKTKKFPFLHKLLVAVILIAFLVIILGGFDAGVRVITITYRTSLACLLIGVVGRIVIRVLVNYEEAKGDKG
jgi:fatty acid desaturase